MRALGVQRLIASCLNDACRRTAARAAILSGSARVYRTARPNVEVPMRCTRAVRATAAAARSHFHPPRAAKRASVHKLAGKTARIASATTIREPSHSTSHASGFNRDLRCHALGREDCASPPVTMRSILVPSADLTCSRPSTTAQEQGP